MQALKTYRKKTKGVSDLLNWAALIDDGIVLTKSGALMAGFFYRGHDTMSSTASERNFFAGRVNATLTRLGSGWVTWHDAIRMPAASYPEREKCFFPDPISALIDEERRQQFMAEGAHFESEYAFILYYTPPKSSGARFHEMLWENRGDVGKSSLADKIIDNFKRTLIEVEDTFSSAVLKLRRMKSYEVNDQKGRGHFYDELVNYLHFCLTGESVALSIPPSGMYMDAFVGGQDLHVGDTPKIGANYICCVAIEGFPHESYPNILDCLEKIAVPYRWSTRMIYLDQHEALKEIKRYRSKWKQKISGFWSQVFKTRGGVINEDALYMSRQAEEAMNEAQSALVTFGYYTPVVVLMGQDREVLLENARRVKRDVEHQGFSCRIESINTMEAWLGTLPGHPYPNIRRPLIHTLHQADLLPLSCVWSGNDINPCPFYPANSPPLAHAASSGGIPFRLNTHVWDIGHMLVFGGTGGGKSTLLAFLAAQFRRYPNTIICAFDKGYSLWALTNACGGKHYDMAEEKNKLVLAPLSVLETQRDMIWAEEWIAHCFELQAGKAPTPNQREEIHRAMQLLKTDKEENERSLTDFCLTVQNIELREALAHYTISGALGSILDGCADNLKDNTFTTFEMDEIMGMGEKNLLPILLYLFRRFERSLTGQPAVLIMDEAWVMLGHPVFKAYIVKWLRELRKSNCSAWLATQSLSDAIKSGIFDILLQSCKTKIILADSDADKVGTPENPGPSVFYETVGLNASQIQLIKSAIPKRHYYYFSPEGQRLFELGLGDVALSFVGVSDKETVSHLKKRRDEEPHEWPYLWLKERGVEYARYQKHL